ncbi:MAG: sigma-70 family RNA polymerase sigma factor [Clostridia bacterium]|nr:sigma-70 family RNA polymerase sigma factor [Clostridia bacterium]
MSDLQINRTDAEIIALYLERDEQAIAETDLKYGSWLLVVAYNILHNYSDSEECRNDTYLSAWNHIPPDQPQVLQAYLLRLTRNHALDRWRLLHRSKRISPEAMVPLYELENVLQDHPAEAKMDSAAIAEGINDWMAAATPRQRYIFLSRYYCMRPLKDIAERTGLSVPGVKKALAKIRQELKERLTQAGVSL